MTLTVFQSDKGDCLLLSAEGINILIDGGMKDSFTDHVSPTLGKLFEDGEKLDLVYVSHIDRDHVWGVLQLTEDLVAWRICDFQRSSGNDDFPAPECRRPPEVGELWHNAFRDLAADNDGEIEKMLATSAKVLEGADEPKVKAMAAAHRELAQSVGDAIELSYRLGDNQLNIPVNRAFGGKLAIRRTASAPIEVGPFLFTILGPTATDLRELRTEWNEWLRDTQAELGRIRARVQRDVERLGLSEIDALRMGFETAGGVLGRRSEVTAPNLASLMFLVTEGKKTLLLTGDGHQQDILKGLDATGSLDANGLIHVDVLKVQHHGSENNIDDEFCQRVTADSYVFCGNGAHENPDLDAIDAIVRSRIGTEAQRSKNPLASGRFKFWFNSNSEASEEAPNRAHMAKVEKKIAEREGESEGRMSSFFLSGSSFQVPI